MFAKISTLILRLFSKSALGILFSKLLSATGSVLIAEITDRENQKKAYEFVKELNARTDIPNIQKAKIFNEKLISWGHSVDKEIRESVANCLRELAVNAIKSEIGL